MTSDLEARLQTLKPHELEQVGVDLLEAVGYTVEPTGNQPGPDGGIDAVLSLDGRVGVVHISTSTSLTPKIAKDAAKCAKHDRDYEFFYYITNADPRPPAKKNKVARKLSEKYGWDVTIWAFPDLRNKLVGGYPEIAEADLSINPSAQHLNMQQQVEQLRDKRLELISTRDNDVPIDLAPGAAIVLHLFPVGFVNMDYGVFGGDLPPPPFYGAPEGMGESIGTGVVSINRRFELEGPSYTYFDEDGWIESVSTVLLEPSQSTSQSRYAGEISKYIDRQFFVMLPRCFACLKEIGAKPPVYVCVSLLDVEDYVLDPGMQFTPRPFSSRYTHSPDLIESFDEDPQNALRTTMDRLWQRGGRRNGSPHYLNE